MLMVPCPGCGKRFRQWHGLAKWCSGDCRKRDRREKAATYRARPEVAERLELKARQERLDRPPAERAVEGVNVGADYSALECEYLKRVDAFRRRKPHPAATDYLRLAIEASEALAAARQLR